MNLTKAIRYKLVLVSPKGIRSDSFVKGAGMLSLREANFILKYSKERLKPGWRYEIERTTPPPICPIASLEKNSL